MARHLFEPARAGALSLANRVVMAPLTRNRAPGAMPHPLMATYYAQRAAGNGGAGLIVSEATAISPMAQGYADVPGIWSDEQVQAWRAIPDAVHAAGGRIVMQLWHVGRISHVDLLPGGAAPLAPSAITANSKTLVIRDGAMRMEPTSAPRALLAQEIPGIALEYAHAARQAMAAGFDGVEVHAANGYLIEQFLKTGANQRSDEWGGPVAARARLLVDILQAVSAAAGADRTGLRLSPVTPANDIVDADPQALYAHVAALLAPMGLAYVHLIEGSTGAARELPDRPFDYAAFKAAWRAAEQAAGVAAPAAWILNNGYDKALAQAKLATGEADLIAFGRWFISNPDLTRRLQLDAPLVRAERSVFYGGGAKGYTDFPALQDQ